MAGRVIKKVFGEKSSETTSANVEMVNCGRP